MLCNWCHKVIPVGEELKEQGSGFGSFDLYKGTGGGSYQHREGGYYHQLCYLRKQLQEIESERDNLWSGWFWLWILFFPVLIIIVIKKNNQMNKLDEKIRDLEEKIRELE